jgi:hypothetical protein
MATQILLVNLILRKLPLITMIAGRIQLPHL